VIDLTKYNALPDTITVKGREYKVHTDFRVWMKFEISITKMRKDDLLSVGYLFPGDMPKFCNINSLLEFSRPRNELPRQTFGNSNTIVLDYELDSDLIYSAFLGQYGIDLVSVEHLHWHKFLALLAGLNDNTRLREVMGYRCYEPSTEKEEIWRAKLRRAWEIDRVSMEEKEELDEFSRLFTK
jgi:hypothetical protein